MGSFTVKQRKFIDYYLITLNGVESARRAGYQGDYNTLGVVAHENLKKPKIKQEIDRRLSELTMTADEVVYRLQEQAKATLEHFVQFNDDGTFWVDLDKAKDAGVLHLAKELKQDKSVYRDKDGNTETTYKTHVKIHDSQSALDKLMRYHGLYNDSVRVKGWHDEVIELLRTGQLTPDEVRAGWPELATDFFRQAGINANSND